MEVLLVSRTPEARAWMRRCLDPGSTFAEAGDGSEALRLAKASAFGLVVTDQTAEPYGAFGLTRELKNLDDAPRVIVLLERRMDAWLARWAGADAWLLQPIDPYELRAAARATDDAPTVANPDAGPDERPRAHAVPGTPFTEAE